MRILFITDNFPPEVNAPATRTVEHCIEWVKGGNEVTVITCVPNFPHGKIYEGYRNKIYQIEYIEGIRVIRVWSYISSNSGFAKRVLDYMSFGVMAFIIGLFQKHDIIVATSPQFFTTWAGWGISKIKNTPWVFELRDIWPESIKTVGAMKESRVLDFLEKIELSLYKSSDKVIAVTDAFKDNLINRGIAKDKIDVVTNGSNMELFFPRKKNELLLNKLGLNGKFIIGYLGTHGMAHSLDFIMNSIQKIEDKNIHFIFVGDGAMKESIISIAHALSLDNVTFYDAISKDEMPDYLSIIDVSLAPLKKSDNFKTVIPSKIFEASAMGKPTLLGVEGQAQVIIEKYNAGICFIPEDENDFIKQVTLLKNDVAIYNACVSGCSELANNFDRKKLAKKMYKILEDLYSKK